MSDSKPMIANDLSLLSGFTCDSGLLDSMARLPAPNRQQIIQQRISFVLGAIGAERAASDRIRAAICGAAKEVDLS